MIQITPQTRIFLCLKPIDFRKGIDGTAAVCRNQLLKDPVEGALFLFRNRSLTTLRMLTYDGQGFWLCTKRLSQGRFQWWPKQSLTDEAITMDVWELQTLLWNGSPIDAKFGDTWRKVQ